MENRVRLAGSVGRWGQRGSLDPSTSPQSRSRGRALPFLLGMLVVGVAALAVVRPWERAAPRSVPRFLIPRLVESVHGTPRTPRERVQTAERLAGYGHYLSALEPLRGLSEPSERSLRLEGSILLALGREEEAEQRYRTVAEANPRNPDALRQLFIVQMQLERRAAARQTLKRFVALASEQPHYEASILREATMASLLLGDPRQALEYAEQYVLLQPNDPGAHVAVCKAALEQRQYGRAAKAITRAAQLVPQDGTLRMLRAQALFGAARSQFRPEVVAELKEAVRLDPYLGRAHYHLGHYYASRQEWKRAAGEYLKAYNLGSEPVRALRGVAEACFKSGLTMEGHFRQAQYYESLGRLDAAITEYAKIWKKQSCCPSGYVHHSDALRRAGRTVEALRIAEQGLKQNPGDRSLTRRQAELYIILGRLEAVKPLLHKLLTLDPERRDLTYRDLASIAETQGQLDQAEAYYQQSLEAAPEVVETHLSLAKVYFRRRTEGDRLRRAEQELTWVLERSPERDDVHAELADVYAEQGRLQEAVDLVRHAIDLAPGRGRHYLKLNQLAQRMGQRETAAWAITEYRKYRSYEEQLDVLNTRVRARPRDPVVRLEYGEFLLRAGDFTAATRELQAAVALNPRSKGARRSLAAAYSGLGRQDDAAEQRMLSRS